MIRAILHWLGQWTSSTTAVPGYVRLSDSGASATLADALAYTLVLSDAAVGSLEVSDEQP